MVGRNQEQLDAFGAFGAEGTAQIEVITVAWMGNIGKPNHNGLQKPAESRSRRTQADFNEDFQERSAGGRSKAHVPSTYGTKEPNPVDVIHLHSEIYSYRMVPYGNIRDFIGRSHKWG